jgi:hypothetical protein
MGTRGQIVVIDPKTKLAMVPTAVRKNFEIAPSLTEAFALWRGVLRAFGQFTTSKLNTVCPTGLSSLKFVLAPRRGPGYEAPLSRMVFDARVTAF